MNDAFTLGFCGRGSYAVKYFCVTSLDKSGMFAGLLIQFHKHHVLLHLGTDSEIKQIQNVTTVSIQELLVLCYNTN